MTNPLFNNTLDEKEASLLYDLSDEMIYNRGVEVEYLPREVVRHDPILNEPLASQFNEVHSLDAFIESSDAFFAGNEIMGPVGLAFSFSSASISISRRKFKAITGRSHPAEGDLIFIKPNQMIFEITNVNARDPLISGGNIFVFVIFLQPFKWGEGHSDFSKSKFKTSEDLGSILDEFIGATDQSSWIREDASTTDLAADTIEVTTDYDQKGITPIVRADTELFTADCELRADDHLGVWNNSALDVMKMMEDQMPAYAQNDEFECEKKEIIINNTNPFGFF